MTNSVNFIFCPPPAGKPNPALPIGSKPRERVAQAAQKGETCWYYALNMIRQRIGKAPSVDPAQMLQRQKELAISSQRKQLTALDEALVWQKKFIRRVCQRLDIETVSKESAAGLLRSLEFVLSRESMHEELALLRSFIQQKSEPDLFSFVTNQYYRDQIRLDTEFLARHTLQTPEQLYVQHKVLPTPWKDLSFQRKAWICDNFRLFVTSMEAYELKISPWNPTQPLEKLLEALKNLGPHFVLGNLGPAYYTEAPFQLTESIEGRGVFGWKPGASRQTHETSHAVVLVGVALDKQRVYFIDPNDASGPEEKSQRIYAMAYENFKQRLFNLRSLQYAKEDQVIHITNDYALYNPIHPKNYA